MQSVSISCSMSVYSGAFHERPVRSDLHTSQDTSELGARLVTVCMGPILTRPAAAKMGHLTYGDRAAASLWFALECTVEKLACADSRQRQPRSESVEMTLKRVGLSLIALACVALVPMAAARARPAIKLVGKPLFAETVGSESSDNDLVVVFRTNLVLPGAAKHPEGQVTVEDYARPVKPTGPSGDHCYTATLTSNAAHPFKVGNRYKLTFIFGRGASAGFENRTLKVVPPLNEFPTCP